MEDERHHFLDIATKVIGMAGIAAGLVVGIVQYRDTKEKEFRKDFWNRQLGLYLEAAKAASTLATISPSDKDERKRTEWDSARTRFNSLYYGELVVVEDPQVDGAMKDFGVALGQYEDKKLNQTELAQLSLVLSSAFKDSLVRSWNLPLDKFLGQYKADNAGLKQPAN